MWMDRALGMTQRTAVDDRHSATVRWAVLSVSNHQLPRRCLSCSNVIPDFAPLHKKFCQARCRANVWSRANRQFASAITVADFENVREQIKRFEAQVNRVVVGYALVGTHPIAKVDRQIGESSFPPKDRKTKRMPNESGRTCLRSTPYYNFSPWFEGPRVPVVGRYRLRVWLEGNPRPNETPVFVEVRKAFPAVHFYDEQTGLRYNLKGEVIPPKPPKPPTERKKREPAKRPQPEQALERALSRERVPERMPAVVAERAPDAELLARVKSLEAQHERQTKERTELLATLEKERQEHTAIRRDLEQKLRAASVPKAPARDDSSSRLAAAEQHNRALDQKLRQVEQSVGQLQARATEQDQKIAKLSTERDELAKAVQAVSIERDELQAQRTTLARQILKFEDERKAQATTAAQAERDRSELAAKLSEVERQRDELTAKRVHQAAPTADEDTADEGADSTPPKSPTGIVIPRLAFGGNLSPGSSPKTGPPSLGMLGQTQRPPIRGSANKKHKRR